LQVSVVVHGSVQDTFRKALKLDPYKVLLKVHYFADKIDSKETWNF
jgi:hypothetical protein